MIDALLHAARPLLAPAFVAWGSPVSGLEIVAFGLGLAMLFANFRVHPAGWPLAIASSLLYALLFADGRLWGQAALQFVFVAVALWGWRQWRRGRGDGAAPLLVRWLSWRGRAAAAAATLAAWPLLAWALARAGSPAPALDALTTAGSVAGQVLLGRKLVDNWAVWLAVNAASVALFAIQALWLTVLLYALFAALSVVGWRQWARLARAGAAHG